MREEDILKEAQEIESTIKEEGILKEARALKKDIKGTRMEFKRMKGPYAIILSIILALLILLMVVPYYSIKIDPEPKSTPLFTDVVPNNIELGNETITSRNEFLKFLNPYDPIVKQTADSIVSKSGCGGNRVCQAKAIFYFVRDNFQYTSDPFRYEYIKTARESLASPAGDCDDMAILLANLEEAIGIKTRFILVPKHVYVDIYLPESKRTYQKEGWVSLDATCKNCDFGKLSYSTSIQEKRVLIK